jgi:hypothetical protein
MFITACLYITMLPWWGCMKIPIPHSRFEPGFFCIGANRVLKVEMSTHCTAHGICCTGVIVAVLHDRPQHSAVSCPHTHCQPAPPRRVTRSSPALGSPVRTPIASQHHLAVLHDRPQHSAVLSAHPLQANTTSPCYTIAPSTRQSCPHTHCQPAPPRPPQYRSYNDLDTLAPGRQVLVQELALQQQLLSVSLQL